MCINRPASGHEEPACLPACLGDAEESAGNTRDNIAGSAPQRKSPHVPWLAGTGKRGFPSGRGPPSPPRPTGGDEWGQVRTLRSREGLPLGVHPWQWAEMPKTGPAPGGCGWPRTEVHLGAQRGTLRFLVVFLSAGHRLQGMSSTGRAAQRSGLAPSPHCQQQRSPL